MIIIGSGVLKGNKKERVEQFHMQFSEALKKMGYLNFGGRKGYDKNERRDDKYAV